jgi:glycosyltransferase involved in cell wall biosynthesis
MHPSLSIIIPVFQAEKYLRPCIDSVLNQSFPDFELILINDGSMDQSGDICDEYARADARIKVIHQENKGQAAARNRGVDNSSGEYVGFVDNDDLVSRGMFETLVNNAREGEADISACSFAQQDEKGNKQSGTHDHEKYLFSNEEGMKELLSREKLDIYVWTKVYKKNFLDEYRIRFEEGKNDEDMLFNYKAFTFSGGCVFENTPLYTYTHRDNSESRSLPKKDLEKYLSGTWYRVNKIEAETKQNYPSLHYLATRQKMIYCIQMIARIIDSSSNSDNVYYRKVLHFLKRNKREVFRNKKHLGLKYIGIALLLFLPGGLYLQYKRFKNRFFP